MTPPRSIFIMILSSAAILALSSTFYSAVGASFQEHQCQLPLLSQQLLAENPAACPEASIREDLKSEPYSEWLWSHPPLCFSGSRRQYCTHTTTNFRAGKGLSIIALPKAAEAATRAFEHARRAPHYHLDFLVEVRDIPGKGKGLVAKRTIEKGRIIMLDSPRIIASAQLPEHMSPSEGVQLLDTAAERLPRADYKAVLSLDTSLGGGSVDDILKTNSFACQLDDGSEGDGYLCLFSSVARINHACRPNAHARFIPRTLLMEIKALRDIAPGDEVSISYGKVDMKHAERQQLYKEGWNFTCTCDLCAGDAYAIRGSDQRRARFTQLHEQLESLTAETYDAQQILAWEKEVLKLGEREGLEVLVAADLERMAYVYLGLGRIEEAKSWARRAKDNLVQWVVADGGPNNELRRVEDLLSDLGT